MESWFGAADGYEIGGSTVLWRNLKANLPCKKPFFFMQSLLVPLVDPKGYYLKGVSLDTGYTQGFGDKRHMGSGLRLGLPQKIITRT